MVLDHTVSMDKFPSYELLFIKVGNLVNQTHVTRRLGTPLPAEEGGGHFLIDGDEILRQLEEGVRRRCPAWICQMPVVVMEEMI